MFCVFCVHLWNGLGGAEMYTVLTTYTALSLASDERKAENTLKMAMPQNFPTQCGSKSIGKGDLFPKTDS